MLKLFRAATIAALIALPVIAASAQEGNTKAEIAALAAYGNFCKGIAPPLPAELAAQAYTAAMIDGIDLSRPERQAEIAIMAGTIAGQLDRAGKLPDFCKEVAAGLGLVETSE